jgi:hypothetical protein
MPAISAAPIGSASSSQPNGPGHTASRHSSSDGGGRSVVRRWSSGSSPSLIPPMARQHGNRSKSPVSVPPGSGSARAPPGRVR